jgi:hypothetical protein
MNASSQWYSFSQQRVIPILFLVLAVLASINCDNQVVGRVLHAEDSDIVCGADPHPIEIDGVNQFIGLRRTLLVFISIRALPVSGNVDVSISMQTVQPECHIPN